MADELEATRHKKRRKKHRERAEVTAASSESPRPPATPFSMLESPAPIAPETLTSTAVAAGKGRKRKQELAAASPLVEEAERKEERKKHKRSRYQEAAATPSPSAPATTAQILEMAAATKEQRRGNMEQGQSCQAPLPVGVHPQGGGAAAADGGASVSRSVKRCRGGKIPVLSDREILRMRIEELRKQQPMPAGFVPAMAYPNPIDQDSNYSSPFGAFFDQFCYKPDRQEGRNAPSLPKTADHPARPLPQDHPPSLSSQLTAIGTFMAAMTTTSNTKQPRSASVSRPQEEVKVKEKKRSEKKFSETKKPRKKSPSLSAAEKRSDKYRRLPLNQLVPPPRSKHNLLQEKYAPDPWKVMVICMLLNVTTGAQVKKKVKGFFKRYPDAQTAYTADPEKMAKYLAPLGCQRVKAKRIQRFSRAYVEEEWTYITELCGIGKYAADAYAIFCAGRATEVVPEDHKLVLYWKFACKLSLTQASQNAQEAAEATMQGNFAP